ncbi:MULTISPECIES: TetR/AcrR family transcriptional regulator [Burkholderia]|jgi:TetR/AcrR family transcriptional regulator, transcriptional repressor for nem operon|uniref:TetR/AcrR family transcriptional regulator n=2 Tax=Burkholderia contaminans TaxID=488447 RepID=A0A1E3FHP1_9BURK|nr:MULTISPECIES: TetR/AcrR family transcriptional regulator [Burkholderia]UTP26377.1 TetR/AcrR family transcriptional regulator [Burkholderia sp. FXe9]KKL29634.1 TetR family transcriptional regulator [Burkholderia contaminans LMG 23361]MBA9833849.1 TetR/AcrR family transcriptional regulator [Burkholderia contaminans]MBA9842518.1 TetR/AcrR family transcriptional regulator [Burkholderia contaminans]MBA9865609.1 TetR/AcrR family transcriptional regulator [Burkholderia contaminans]
MTITGDSTAGRILEAGRQLIMRRGYSGFSYADIADAIDIRKASIHHHFPTKADLAVAVLQQSQANFDADMSLLDASGADALVQMRAYIGYWERCIADDSAPFCVAGMLGAELPALPDDVARAVRAHFDDLAAWLVRVLEAGVKDGVVQPGISVQTEAATFVSLVYGAMLAARAYGNAGMFKDVTGGAVERLAVPRKRA